MRSKSLGQGGAMGVGIALGVGLGVALDNLALGIACGVAFGAAFMTINRRSNDGDDENDGGAPISSDETGDRKPD